MRWTTPCQGSTTLVLKVFISSVTKRFAYSERLQEHFAGGHLEWLSRYAHLHQSQHDLGGTRHLTADSMVPRVKNAKVIPDFHQTHSL